jgi:hypothetical protein
MSAAGSYHIELKENARRSAAPVVDPDERSVQFCGSPPDVVGF